MTAEKLTKIIGISCIIFVFISMLLPGTYTILIGLIILLPLALYDRKLMRQEENVTKDHLKKYHAVCAFMGICYEGYNGLKEHQKCEVLFKRNEIIVFELSDIEDSIKRQQLSIDKSKIKNVEILNLWAIKEKSQTSMYEQLGKLGKFYYENIGKQEIIKKSRKDRNVYYLFINFMDEKKSSHTISIYANNTFQYFNSRATSDVSIEKFCKENY